MSAIRWMGLYGAFQRESLKWELTQKEREVSAEWTIRDRPFISPSLCTIGLLLKSSAVIRKHRCDVYTSYDTIAKWRHRQKLDPEKFNSHLWEAICYPDYAGIVITANFKATCHPVWWDSMILQALEASQLPLLILQADNKTLKTGTDREFGGT